MVHSQSDTTLLNIRPSEADRWNALKKESTLLLIRRIAEDSDELALRVFHETRTLFYRKGKWVRLAEFVIALRDRSIRGQGEDEDDSGQIYMTNVTDEAYDLTLAKFYNIPSRNHAELTSNDDTFDAKGFTWGVDCRLYFKRLLESIHKELREEPTASEMNTESKISKIATTFVIREFSYSKLECKRRDTSSIRYAWHVQGRIIYLFRPSHLTATQFRKWLEEHVKDIDLDNPNKINRIQEMIDKKYPSVSPQRDDPEIAETPASEEQDWIEQKEGKQFSNGLSVHVAKEKSANLENLRPAIQSIGKEGVYNLVNRIFTDVIDEQYNLSEVARDYNLSKATLSRFAGSEWVKDKDISQISNADIPDLWINTAHVLAEHPEFMEIVMNTGFKDVIDNILRIIDPQEDPKNE